MRIECKSCGAKGNFDESRLPVNGANVNCPRCKEKIWVSRQVEDVPVTPAAEPFIPPVEINAPTPIQPPPVSEGPQGQCTMCKRVFTTGEMVQMQGRWVCGECKPNYVQMLKIGLSRPGDHRFAGFWIRFGAKFIDGMITGIVSSVLLIPLWLVFNTDITQMSSGEDGAIFLVLGLQYLIQFGIPLAYTVFFLGKFQATPGKMACGLKVIRSDDEPLTYMRALGRGFSEMLSYIIFLIGYIMAAFDEEKRALHDRICDTRVIYK